MTKINTYSKGNRIEKELRDIHEANGWLIWKPSRARFQSNDIFGIFDFLAIQKNTKGLVTMIQVKSAMSHYYSARLMIQNWLKANRFKSPFIAGVAVRLKKNEWRMWVIEPINLISRESILRVKNNNVVISEYIKGKS